MPDDKISEARMSMNTAIRQLEIVESFLGRVTVGNTIQRADAISFIKLTDTLVSRLRRLLWVESQMMVKITGDGEKTGPEAAELDACRSSLELVTLTLEGMIERLDPQ